jgi:hypothetical protein
MTMFADGMGRLLPLLMLLVCGPPISAQSPQPAEGVKPIKKREPTAFVRVQNDEFDEPLSLQTATVKYVLKDESGDLRVEVFLESAIHIGDAAYYRGFNRRFPHYDVVLYELIASAGEHVPDPDNGKTHPAKLLQQMVGDSLGFKHQIDEIDYKAENMVHCDLSPKEMREARQQRGDDDIVLLADIVVDMLRNMNDTTESSESTEPLDLSVLSDPDGGIKLRRMMARTLNGADSPASFLYPTQLRSLINDRNEKAMEVFQQQVDKGHRSIAFFWGAAHMPDLEKRLILDYGFERESVRWRGAWDLREGSVERAPLDSAVEKTVRSFLNGALDEFFQKPQR